MTPHPVAWAAALIVVLPACSSGDPPPRPPEAAPTTSSPSAPLTTSSPSPPPTTKPVEPPPSSPSARPTRPPASDRRGDLVRGYRTLVGTIEAAGPCPVLRVGGERWALVGERTRGVAAGQRFEVRGTVTTPPRGCRASRALLVSQLVSR